MVQSVVPSGKKAGTHIGKVAVRASGSFNVSTMVGVVQVSVTNIVLCYTGRMGIRIYQKQALLSAFKTEYPRPGGFMKVLLLGGRKRACNSMETFTVPEGGQDLLHARNAVSQSLPNASRSRPMISAPCSIS